MTGNCHLAGYIGGSAPATPRFTAVAPKGLAFYGATLAAPVLLASESTLGSHPCVALSSAQVPPEWINRSPAVKNFPSAGAYPLNFVSQPRGSLQKAVPPYARWALLDCFRCLPETLARRLRDRTAGSGSGRRSMSILDGCSRCPDSGATRFDSMVRLYAARGWRVYGLSRITYEGNGWSTLRRRSVLVLFSGRLAAYHPSRHS